MDYKIEEERLAKNIKNIGSIKEQSIHTLYYESSKMAGIDPWGFGIVLDPSIAYSPKLHEIIESAIKKGYLIKGLDDLLASK